MMSLIPGNSKTSLPIDILLNIGYFYPLFFFICSLVIIYKPIRRKNVCLLPILPAIYFALFLCLLLLGFVISAIFGIIKIFIHSPV